MENNQQAIVIIDYGLGNLGSIYLKSLKSICDISQSRLSSFDIPYPDIIKSLDVQDILQDPTIEAVFIATPTETHADLVKEALLTEKDVFVEKPLCLSVEQGERLINLARESIKFGGEMIVLRTLHKPVCGRQ